MPDDDVGRLLRRLRDIEIAEQLHDEGCTGPLWQLVRADLARIALRALAPLLPGRKDLLLEAVARGLETFRSSGIMDRCWVPAGQSLREHAVAHCTAAVPVVLDGRDPGRAEPAPSVGDPGVAEWERALHELPEPLRSAVGIRLHTGQAWASIAPVAGTTTSRLQTQLGLLREGRGHGDAEAVP